MVVVGEEHIITMVAVLGGEYFSTVTVMVMATPWLHVEWSWWAESTSAWGRWYWWGRRSVAVTQIGSETLPPDGSTFVPIICFLFGDRGESLIGRGSRGANLYSFEFHLTLFNH